MDWEERGYTGKDGAVGKDADAPSEQEWYSRGYLPHRDAVGLIQSITFRLADSLPGDRLKQWEKELASLPESRRLIERARQIQAWLDQGHGECWLRDSRFAQLVENALLHFDGASYRLLAWCIMPNHVHALVETQPGHPLSGILHSWKSFTASRANRWIGRRGAFWQREYHDRFMRDEKHLHQAIEYIEQNPVKAGLVASPEQWRFSSAYRRRG
jgi:putative DNA methylase